MATSERRALTQNNLTVSTRLIGGFAVVTILAAGIGAIGWYSVRSIDSGINNIKALAGSTIKLTDDLIARVWKTPRSPRTSLAYTTWTNWPLSKTRAIA